MPPMIRMYKRIWIQWMKCRGRLILCCVAREEMPEALDNGSQPYSRAYGYGEMAGKGLSSHHYQPALG